MGTMEGTIKTKKQRIIGGGDSVIENIYLRLKELEAAPRETKYVNDEYGNFYSVINNIYVTKNDIKMIINGIYKIHFSNIVPKGTKEKQMLEIINKRFIVYYLDEIYTRLFSLSGSNETYDEDIYYQYLSIKGELDKIKEIIIQDANDIFKLVEIHEKLRDKWNGFYLEEIKSSLRGDLTTIHKRLVDEHNNLYDIITKNIVMNLTPTTRKRARTTSARTTSARTTSTRKNSRSLRSNLAINTTD